VTRLSRWIAGIIVPGLLLAGCSTLPPDAAERVARAQLYETRMDRLGALTAWSLQGRLAVNDGQDGGSGTLFWQQWDDSARMNFHGALGRGAWQLQAEDDAAVLELADGRRFEAGSVDELVRTELGWQIPVDSLAWWVRGLAAPGAYEQRSLDQDGRLLSLSQRGWIIEFGRYRPVGAIDLPLKLTARSADRSVKLAVRDWRIDGLTAGDEP
jgi:outer membrane lipoprotein LolB